MQILHILGVLAAAASATAQVTTLGGGTAPLFVSGDGALGSTVQISPLPAPFPVVILGLSRVDVPLQPLGAGCPDIQIPNVDATGAIAYTIVLPNNPALLGGTIYAQGVLLGIAPCFLFGTYFRLTEAVQITIH